MSGEGQLVEKYYNRTCPNVEAIVRQAVEKKVNQTFFTIPATLRLFFHDCFVEGCDASILVVSPNQTAERYATENLSLAGDGFDTVIQAKKAVETACPHIVSCADILTIATRDVVSLAGGPNYTVELGRLDGLISNAGDVRGNIPKPEFNLSQLNAMFVKHNLSQTDMIALTGCGHTVGFSHCRQFASRLYSFNGTNTTDPTLNSTYAKELMQACPAKNSDNDTVVNLDPLTPITFDNVYYKNLVAGRGLFSSDQVLFTDKASRSKVVDFANNTKEFNDAFVEAMKKLGRVGVKTRKTIEGTIRTDDQFIELKSAQENIHDTENENLISAICLHIMLPSSIRGTKRKKGILLIIYQIS